MDKLELVEPEDPRTNEAAIFFKINGQDLGEMLKPLGCLDRCVTLQTLAAFLNDTVFKKTAAPPKERLLVLECGCGSMACGNTSVRVTRRGNRVEWSAFAKGWQENYAPYKKAGPFEFEAAAYDAAMKRGRELLDAWMQGLDPETKKYYKQRISDG